MEIVKRMITVKAKKQTELALKRKNRSSNANGTASKARDAQSDNMSVESASGSPLPSAPVPSAPPQHHRPQPAITSLSAKFSPTPAYTYEYRPSENVVPRPYQHGRITLPLSPQSAQSAQTNPADISDIFLAQTQRTIPLICPANLAEYIQAVRELQGTIRVLEGSNYALQSKIIELERQLEVYRSSDIQPNGQSNVRKPYRGT